MSLTRVLTESEETLLVEERRALGDLRVTLERLELQEADRASFEASIHQLDELFLLVVAGEFNAGKSAFINALVGAPLLKEGVTPTTQKITLLTYGENRKTTAQSDALELVEAPVDVLRKVNIVDTPGTNAIHREHEAITRDFVPRSDMVLFVTSADRPFTESERAFLESIRDWGKKIVFVVNKIDILDDGQIDEVLAFVADNAVKLLDVEPDVFPVSARWVQKAREEDDARLLEKSRFGALEASILRTLDDRERVRLKLLNPVGVGQALTEKYLTVVTAELELLRDDLSMLQEVETQLELYVEDQKRDFDYRLSDIDNALLDFESRGSAYFEETMRLGRVFDLVNKAKIKSEFEKQVVADLPQVVEKRVEAVIDWMVESELKQWKAVVEHLDARRSAHEKRMVGKFPSAFDQDRKRLLESVGAAARRAIETYDKESESSRLADSLQAAVAGTALLEVGAVGLGTLVAMIATTTAVDVTGILAASAISVVGLLVLPAKKRRAKAELTKKVGAVREQLMSSLKQQFEGEMRASVSRIEEAIAPYTRFVRSERERLDSARLALEESGRVLGKLKTDIHAL